MFTFDEHLCYNFFNLMNSLNLIYLFLTELFWLFFDILEIYQNYMYILFVDFREKSICDDFIEFWYPVEVFYHCNSNIANY